MKEVGKDKKSREKGKITYIESRLPVPRLAFIKIRGPRLALAVGEALPAWAVLCC